MQTIAGIDLLTKAELAAEAGVSIHTIDKWIARGTSPRRTRLGGRVYFRKEHVAEWIDARESL